jgi:UDP-glucose 4-epimerase
MLPPALPAAPIPVIDAPRREGDPARLVADGTTARRDLGWQPTRIDLKTLIEDAWKWELKVRPGSLIELN